jgi:putative aldouronate transport system permease protein
MIGVKPTAAITTAAVKKATLLWDIRKNKYLYIMLLPVLLYYAIFHYFPMYGSIIAFKDYSPRLGIWGSPWAGFEHFLNFFNGPYFSRVLSNTLMISFYELLFGFPAPIVLAMLLNEVRISWFKRMVQTFTYMPHFISLVVICGMLKEFSSSSGIITSLISLFGGPKDNLLMSSEWFRTLFVGSGIWQQIGWGSIIYLAALTSIDTEQYEAARIDGANRFQQMRNITFPGIMPTIIIMLILDMGRLLNVGFEKIILLYNPATYETADVISSYVYRVGLQEFNYSFSAAIGLFNSVINFSLVIMSNWISRKINDTSLW